MLSEEEKKAIEWVKNNLEETIKLSQKYGLQEAIKYQTTILNLIEKQQKEIEELKEDRKKYAEEYIHNNPWLYKQLNENYILRVESEQKERKAYIKGTNDAHDLCNKKWKDKIKAKIEEYKKQIEKMEKDDIGRGFTLGKEWSDLKAKVEFGQSLLEKE